MNIRELFKDFHEIYFGKSFEINTSLNVSDPSPKKWPDLVKL